MTPRTLSGMWFGGRFNAAVPCPRSAPFSWNVPKLILAEVWSALIHMIGSQSGKKEKRL